MEQAIKRLKDFFGKKNTLNAAVALGIVGMLLILLSGIGSGNGKSKSDEPTESGQFDQNSAYRAELEQELTELLSQISGVGKAEVMITLSSTEKYVYAEESTVSGDKHVSEYAAADKGGIVTHVRSPEITGALIVCEGGGNSQVCERIYKAVSVSLGIPSSRICVAKMK